MERAVERTVETDPAGVLAYPAAGPIEHPLRQLRRAVDELLETDSVAQRLDRVRRAAALRELVGAVEVEEVRGARSARMSWERIGDTIGVSRQAAYRRFAPLMPGAQDASEPGGRYAPAGPAASDALAEPGAAGRPDVPVAQCRPGVVTPKGDALELIAIGYRVLDLFFTELAVLVSEWCSPELTGVMRWDGPVLAWQAVRAQFGDPLYPGGAEFRFVGAHSVVEIGVEFERGAAVARFAFDPWKRIEGFRFVAVGPAPDA